MTEKEKMISCLLYDASDKQLTEDRLAARNLTYEFNQSHPNDEKFRKNIIRKLFGSTKEHFKIEPSFHCDYGYNITVGENFFANFNAVFLDVAEIIIGDNCMFGPNVSLYTATHPINALERNSGLEYAKKIVIGNNVWLGGSVVVLPGVVIGDNVVIGAGSVVTKDIPSNSCAFGNPAKIVKTII